MSSLSTSQMRVSINGTTTEDFKPTRGIRQGDPLSPYIFVLCMERLENMIHYKVNIGGWKPLKLGRNRPCISHLFFFNNLILFAKASKEQIRTIKYYFDNLCARSGQNVSLSKSRIFFSRNVSRDLAEEISTIITILITTDLGRYLEVPIIHSKTIKRMYNDIVTKVQDILVGWQIP